MLVLFDEILDLELVGETSLEVHNPDIIPLVNEKSDDAMFLSFSKVRKVHNKTASQRP